MQCVKYACELDGLPTGPMPLQLRSPMKKELRRTMRDAVLVARTTIGRIIAE